MFFQTINQVITAGTDLAINIRRVNDKLAVSVMPRRASLKDNAGEQIVPLVLNGTPEELDAGFLQAIATPMQKVQGVLTNLEAFEKQAEQASSQSKAAKSAAEKESREAREKREKMEKLIKKAEEATAGKRYSEALTCFKQARVLAAVEKQKEIDTKMAEVQKKAAERSLFGMEPVMPAPQPTAQPVTPQAPQPIPQPQAQPVQQSIQPMQYAQPVPQPEMNGSPVGYPYGQPVQAPQPMPQPQFMQQPQPVQFHQPVQMPARQPMNGDQWQQPVPPQPQAAPMQPAPGINGNREYRSQPQQGLETFSFDKDDEYDRELLRDDPYAEYPDFPAECRMKDEAQMELVYC